MTKFFVFPGLAILTLTAPATLLAAKVSLTEMNSAMVHYADVSTGKTRGTLILKFSIKSLNSCVADHVAVKPIAVKGMTIDPNSTNRIPLLLVFQKTNLPGLENCTKNAKEIVRYFETEIGDLVPGARYDIQISGMPELGASSAFREEAAGS